MAKFELLSRPLGTIERFVITSDNGAELEILAGHGAGLNAWRVPVTNGVRELLYGYQSEKALREIHADTNAGVRLSPFAGRTNMAKWDWNEKTYFLENNVSWAPHALHGLLHIKPWRFISFSAEESFAELTLAYDWMGGHPGFPFPYRAETRFRFSGNSFQVTSIVENRGIAPMPYSEGFHPYYSLGTKIDDLQIQLPPVKRAILNELDIPTGNYQEDARFEKKTLLGNTFINDYFALKDPTAKNTVISLYNAKNKEKLEISQGLGYKGIQIYTPPHRQNIAIEPMTHEPDVLNHHRDLLIIEPQKSLSFSFEASFTVFM